MTDYINREDAIEVYSELYWMHEGLLNFEEEIGKVYDEILGIPPADVMPVVRCKDCVYRVIMRDPLRKPMDCYGCRIMHYNEDDWFCSFGERKDDDTD